MAEYGALLKPDLELCPCGCGVEGRPRVKAWRDGLHHARTCRCHRCLAPTYRKNAAKRERKIAKVVGGERSPLSGALNGADVVGGIVDVEETFNKTVVRGVRAWWESKGTAAKVGRLLARNNGVPKALVLGWDRRQRLVLMTWDDFAQLCQIVQTMDDQP